MIRPAQGGCGRGSGPGPSSSGLVGESLGGRLGGAVLGGGPGGTSTTASVASSAQASGSRFPSPGTGNFYRGRSVRCRNLPRRRARSRLDPAASVAGSGTTSLFASSFL